MKEIKVENIAPVIFTKDREWYEREAQDIRAVPGAIILLPDDAVLVFTGDLYEIRLDEQS
jgi:hypothetical protein